MPALIVLYDAPVSAASGEIWDIDGTGPLDSEQWSVEALGQEYIDSQDPDAILATVLSPEATNHDLDGRPWVFSIELASAEIFALRISHIGTRAGVGLAFDNFSPASPARPCDDGFDNELDGSCDTATGACVDGSTPGDPGCADADDLSERSPLLACDDGADNDGDGRIDFDPVTFLNPGDADHLPVWLR